MCIEQNKSGTWRVRLNIEGQKMGELGPPRRRPRR